MKSLEEARPHEKLEMQIPRSGEVRTMQFFLDPSGGPRPHFDFYSSY